MTQTPLEEAESQFRSISIKEQNGRFAAIRQVLKDRERSLRAIEKVTRLKKRMASRDPA